jgi:hypothetical protein
MIPIIFLLISVIWVPLADGGYEKYDVIYGDIKVCGGYSQEAGKLIKACWDGNAKNIQVMPQFKDHPTLYGQTVWEHEVFHAWGWTHSMMEWHYFKGQYR